MWYTPITWGRIRQLSNLNMAIIASDAQLPISLSILFVVRIVESPTSSHALPLPPPKTPIPPWHCGDMLSLPPSSLRLLGASIGRRYVWCGGGEEEEEDAARAFGCSHVQYISAGRGEWRDEGQRRCCCSFPPHPIFPCVRTLFCRKNSLCRCT